MANIECAQCGGSGRRVCPFCDGSKCEFCEHTGVVVCWDCGGLGKR